MSSREMRLQRHHDRLTELGKSKRGGAMTGGAMVNTDTDVCQVVLGQTGQTYRIYYTGVQNGIHTFNTANPAAPAYPPGMKVVPVVQYK